MSFIDKYIPTSLKGLFSYSERVKKEIRNAEQGKGKRVFDRIKRHRLFKAQMEQDERRQAIDMAKDPHFHDRRRLYAIYEETLDDGHVIGQLGVTKNKIQSEPFEVYNPDTGEKDEDLTRLLQRPWFYNYIDMAIMAEFWGHSLVEFQEPVPSDLDIIDREFNDVKLIPREHVKPEIGEILIQVIDRYGLPFREKPLNKWLVEIGDKFDLGLLMTISKEVIWKNYSRSDWSRHSEKFGMPQVAIKTSATGEKELDNLEESARTFGHDGYIITGLDDEVDLIQNTQNQPHTIYEKKAEFCNEEASKAMNGQTLASEEGSSRSQGEVHERVLNVFIKGRLRKIEDHVNYTLFPFLRMHNYPLQNASFRYPILDESDMDNTPDPSRTGQKKKSPNITTTNHLEELRAFYANTCSHAPQMTNADQEQFRAKVEEIARKLHAGELTENQISAELHTLIGSDFFAGFKNAYNKDVTFDMPDNEFLATIQNNLFAFSGAKNFDMMRQLRDGLLDSQGRLKSQSEFLKYARQINEQYNANYLATERNMVRRSGHLGSQWMDIQRDKDLFPYLEYRTVGDQNVREEHEKMEGIIRPVDDAFWSNFYPPNGWNCRCSTRKLSEREVEGKGGTTDRQRAEQTAERNVTDQYWRKNVGEQQQVFDLSGHPYTKSLSTSQINQLDAVTNYGMATLKKIYADPKKLNQVKETLDTEEDYRRWYKEMEKRHGSPEKPGEFILVDNQTGNRIKIEATLREKPFESQNPSQHFSFFKELSNVVNYPDEVFANHFKTSDQGKMVFIRYYEDSPIILFVEKREQGFVATDFKKVNNPEEQRKGLLYYKKAKQ